MDMHLFDNLTGKKIIGDYSLKEIRERGNISLTLPLNDKTMDILINYLYEPVNINLKNNDISLNNEKKYIEDLKIIFSKLNQSKKKYNIDININNREILRQSNLLQKIPNNIKLTINASEHSYNYLEYLKEENKIEEMIAPVRRANLSPLENFLAVYDIVKNYKPYRDNVRLPKDAVILNRILSDNNEFIVCEGFARLLSELLTRVGIPSKCVNVYVDISNDRNFKGDRSKLRNDLHTRNLVKIDDDKYNIHGFYLSDSTWDNNPQYNLYLNSLMTFDRKKEARRLERLEDIDLLMDFHDVDEFIEKIKYFIKMRISKEKIDAKMEDYLRCNAYKNLYLKIIDILSSTDSIECQKLYDKYNDLLNIDVSKITSNKLETVLGNLLIDYAKYMMPLVNNEISNKAFISALIEVQKNVYYKSDLEIKEWLEDMIDANKKFNQGTFPYVYDYQDKREGYVSVRHK